MDPQTMMSEAAKHWRILWALALRQLRDRYAGTLVGATWAIVHPLLLLIIYWMVFAVGFRVKPNGSVPFVLVLFAGLVPWLAFYDAVAGSVNAVSGHAYLVKKVAFPLQMLPLASVVAAMIPHIAMLVALGAFVVAEGIWPGWRILLVIPYAVGLAVLASGLSMLLAAINVFHRDIGQALSLVLNLWFWATPIVWSLDMLPPQYGRFLALNPLVWVVDGYRAVFLGIGRAIPIFDGTLYFVVVALIILLGGRLAFRRLQPYFADVL